jgi:hypothetical protein
LWNWKHAPLQSAKMAITLSYSKQMHCSIATVHYLSANMMAVLE